MLRRFFWIVGISSLVVATACAPRLQRRPVEGHVEPLIPGRPAHGGTVTVGLDDPVDPAHAPVGVNDSERLLFRHLYETLVSLDSGGTPQPALALSWSSYDAGKTWIFRLDPTTRDWDRNRVLAQSVISCWKRNERVGLEHGCPAPWIWFDEWEIEAVTESTIRIVLPRADVDLPRLLASPSFAYASSHIEDGWPIGTGPYRVAHDPSDTPGRLTCRPNEMFRGDASFAELYFDMSVDRDPLRLTADLYGSVRTRARLARAVDLGYQSIPRPWDLNYLLLVPPDSSEEPSPLAWFDPDPSDLSTFCDADACPSDSITFPDGPLDCQSSRKNERQLLKDQIETPRETIENSPRVILYPVGDADAKGLAERIVYRLRFGQPVRSLFLSCEGIDDRTFADRVSSGTDFAYLLPLHRSYAEGKLLIRDLAVRVPWLRDGIEPLDESKVEAEWIRRGRVIPLVLTRPRVVYRSGLVGGAVDGLGRLELDTIGWEGGVKR